MDPICFVHITNEPIVELHAFLLIRDLQLFYTCNFVWVQFQFGDHMLRRTKGKACLWWKVSAGIFSDFLSSLHTLPSSCRLLAFFFCAAASHSLWILLSPLQNQFLNCVFHRCILPKFAQTPLHSLIELGSAYFCTITILFCNNTIICWNWHMNCMVTWFLNMVFHSLCSFSC